MKEQEKLSTYSGADGILAFERKIPSFFDYTGFKSACFYLLIYVQKTSFLTHFML